MSIRYSGSLADRPDRSTKLVPLALATKPVAAGSQSPDSFRTYSRCRRHPSYGDLAPGLSSLAALGLTRRLSRLTQTHKIAIEDTALAANGSLRRMYLPTSASEAWPVCALIRQVGAPAVAALVTNPARSECPEYRAGSRPIALTRCFTMDAIESPEVDRAAHARVAQAVGTPALG